MKNKNMKSGRPAKYDGELCRLNLKIPADVKEYLTIAAAQDSIEENRQISITEYIIELISADKNSQQTNNNEDKKMRTRNEDGYRHTLAKNGSLTVHLSPDITEKIMAYCQRNNLNKAKFVEDCVKKQLIVAEREELTKMDHDMLVELCLAYQNR